MKGTLVKGNPVKGDPVKGVAGMVRTDEKPRPFPSSRTKARVGAVPVVTP